MDYELAKSLKEAGFPQDQILGHKFYPNKGCTGWTQSAFENGVVVDKYILDNYFSHLTLGYQVPTLSELIEACSSVEFLIYCYPKGHNNDITNKTWFVVKRPNLMDMQRCSTPEEAVARLWMKLVDCEPKKK